jgi:serine/threonine protein kinase
VVQVGPYQIEYRLASGGMAEVYVAKRVGPHGFVKRFALKRILPQHARDPDFVAMFIDEARLASKLEHPNIVQVVDFGDSEDDLFLAMELVVGTNVNRLLRAVSERRDAVPVDIAFHVALETARALAYAHALRDDFGEPIQIVHRDVSPANILLTRTGHVKLNDFGIARASVNEQRTDTGRLRGKVGYMSPEQVLGKSLDGRSDVFTLTTVLAEMLIAEPLFGQGTDLDVLLRVRDADLRVLRDSKKNVPADVRRLLGLGLAKDPRDRPAADELANALNELMHKRGYDAGPERLVKLLTRLELVDGEALLDPSEGSHTSVVPLAFELESTSEVADTIEPPPFPEKQNVMWRVRLANGDVLGPISFPKLVELITTGIIDSRTQVAKNGAAFAPSATFTELTRFVTSPAMQWSSEEVRFATRRGRILPGSVLPIVFSLCAERTTGVLHLNDGKRRKKLYFVDGRPDFIASTDRRELLGEYLVERGLCLKMEVEMALAVLPKYGGRLGDALVGLGVLRPVELFRAISDQVRARYVEAFNWSEGEWCFVPNARSYEDTFPLRQDAFELMREVVQTMPMSIVESALEPYMDCTLVRVANPPVSVDSFRPSLAWSDTIHRFAGYASTHALVELHMLTSSDREDFLRAVYWAVSCKLIAKTVNSVTTPDLR